MNRLWGSLPGPTAVKVLEAVVVVAVCLVALGFFFEWAGNLLDSGGAIGV